MARHKAAPERPGPLVLPTIEVRPEGPLAGHVLRMRTPSTRFFIAQRRAGGLTNADMWDEILDAIVEHDFDREPDLLPPAYVLLIGNAWLSAIKEQAVPPVSGETSG